MMNLALNNATNVAQADHGDRGEHASYLFKACGNTQENMSKAENKEIALVSEAKVVKSGVVRVMELQERGWSYVKP
ncbi:hypothetical protein [Afipia massiliensis]|uniref:DsrE family protein n=1 Tax=Afipia massiliensis TaxID=211460 RepID=UPI00069BBE51